MGQGGHGPQIEPRSRGELERLVDKGHLDLRAYFLWPRIAEGFEDRRERPGERSDVRALRKEDCRKNLLPLITEELIHNLLDPRTDPVPDNPVEEREWWIMTNIGPAVCRYLDLDHPNLWQIDEYYDSIAAKVRRIMKKSDRIEARPYTPGVYMYRYTDDDRILERAAAKQEKAAKHRAAVDRAIELRRRGKRLGVRINASHGKDGIVQGFFMTADELERLLARAEAKP